MRRLQWILSFVLGGVLLLGTLLTPGFAADGLFSDAGGAEVSSLQMGRAKPDPTVARTRYVRINFDRLKGTGFPNGAESVLLNLYDDLSYDAARERLEKRSANRYTWFGRVAGVALSQVVLVVEDGVMAGNIMVNGEFYQVRSVGGGIHAVRKIDQSKFPEEAPPIPIQTAPDQSELLSPSAGADDGSTIDVLVVYTADAASASSNIAAEIQLAIDETNQSYSNSGIAQRVRLAHAAQVSYVETGKGGTDLVRLKSFNDGYLDEVHSIRNSYAADLVSLWVEKMDACGVGYLMSNVSTAFASSAFSVVRRDCATGYYSFGHEMGHNMGAHHDRYAAKNENGAYAYSHGYVDKPGKWRTVMAYDADCNASGFSCTRIQYWSNPNVDYQGNPTGIDNSANNALTLNNTAYTVSNFRSSSSPLPMPQCDMAIGFNVTLSGKSIEDGYSSSSFTKGPVYFDICTTVQGNTLDSFVGYLYDNQYDYWQVSGTIIWNKSVDPTSAYFQGTYHAAGSMPYIDGTIRYSRGKYSISAKGGSSDGATFIESYSSVKGSGYVLPSDQGAAGASLRNRKSGIQGPGRAAKSDRVSKPLSSP